ncbi:hypothetical protein [Lutibacter sp.]|uniref:hypothetical protein n=1 Tax=Lutibacter sp. TaxID=1925666 RepID=UPI0025B7CD49|nr:hypothetical protein [Lutibacter sp.]MCF6180422.1 hypothetical protein [Lutibacter sp.]
MILPVISELLNKIQNESLYLKLIQQLNKDFLLANLPYRFLETETPKELINSLTIILQKIIVNNYDGYLNLIYRIDLSEKELANIKEKSLELIVENITFLILKREYQKVWFKNTI